MKEVLVNQAYVDLVQRAISDPRFLDGTVRITGATANEYISKAQGGIKQAIIRVTTIRVEPKVKPAKDEYFEWYDDKPPFVELVNKLEEASNGFITHVEIPGDETTRWFIIFEVLYGYA